MKIKPIEASPQLSIEDSKKIVEEVNTKPHYKRGQRKREEMGKNDKGKMQSKVGRDILFIERNLDFLKPGGRMAIVLPQGRFNNSSDKYIREFIADRCRILAVVGLHGNVFKPHTGTKTSVLFVQKWDDELWRYSDMSNPKLRTLSLKRHIIVIRIPDSHHSVAETHHTGSFNNLVTCISKR